MLIIAILFEIPQQSHAVVKSAPGYIHVAASRKIPPKSGTPKYRAWIICRVFKGYCHEAINVVWCESTLSPFAANGQFRGMFQMGSSERARYGHSNNNAWIQARSAFKYFRASGSDWSPWECKPF